jgi:lamin tail-like protein
MRIRALLIAFLVVAASVLTAVQANAAATVYIYKVYFDSPGSDTGSNSSLNAEYVVIKNGDNVSHSISGWTVRDRAGHRYTFPDGFRLGAGKQAIIHTGDAAGTPPLPVPTSIGVGNGMCGTTLATR